ncbi:MAG: fimbrillin family protein [Rikenellaceae bacterium]|nr:fimbrillin family protein [Rikenellaceae bacterium]MCL2691954.1 fimbrillin family protein [Rikenellaceae bacterium]
MRIRNIILLLLAAALFAGCGEELIETRNANIIEFSPFRSTSFTRGIAVNNPADIAAQGGFKVWGYRHTGTWLGSGVTLFDGTTVTSTDGGVTWSYGTPVHWPMNELVSFFGYAPASAAGVVTVPIGTPPQLICEVAVDPAAQIDLLIAVPQLDRHGYIPVEMNFRHVLSRVTFSARKAAGVTAEIRISKIELRNLYRFGTTDFMTHVWTPTGVSSNFVLTTAAGLLENTALTTSSQMLSTTAGTMFMMPQTLVSRPGGSPPDAELWVTFTAHGYEFEYMVSTFPSAAWQSGVSYNYELLLDGFTVVAIIRGELENPITGPGWGSY